MCKIIYVQVEGSHLEVNSLQLDIQVLRREKDELSRRCEHLELTNNTQSSKESIDATSSSQLMLALLHSEKDELSSELTDLGFKDVSVKCLAEKLHLEMQEVSELKATILSMEKQLSLQESFDEQLKLRDIEMDDLKDRLELLGEQCRQKVVLTEQLDARHLDISRLMDQVKLLEEELQTKNCMEKNFHLLQRQNSELKRRAEVQLDSEQCLDVAIDVTNCWKTTQHKLPTNEVKDVNMHVKSSVAGSFDSEYTACHSIPLTGTVMCVERQCETEDVLTSSWTDIFRYLKWFRMSEERSEDETILTILPSIGSLNRESQDLIQTWEPPSVICSSSADSQRCLMERLQMEHIQLQEELQQTKKACDSWQHHDPPWPSTSTMGCNALNAVHKDYCFGTQQEQEDKVRHMENVVRQLEQISDLATAPREGDSVVSLQQELCQEILEPAKETSDAMSPGLVCNDVQPSPKEICVQFSQLKADLEKLQGENNVLMCKFIITEKSNKCLGERIKDFEVENNCLKKKLHELEKNKHKGSTTMHSFLTSDAQTVQGSGLGNLIGGSTMEENALETWANNLEQHMESSLVSALFFVQQLHFHHVIVFVCT